MSVLIIAMYNEDGSVDIMNTDNLDVNLVETIAINPYARRYYKVSERIGNDFKDGLKLK